MAAGHLDHQPFSESREIYRAVRRRRFRADGLPKVRVEIYNDIDGEIVNLFAVLRDPASAARLQRLCELTPYARGEFELAYCLVEEPIERARRTLVRSWMGHGASGLRGHRTGFRVSTSRQRTEPQHDWANWCAEVAAISARLREVVIECRPARQLLVKHNEPGVLAYLDPPYPFGTRSQKRKGNDLYHGYRHEMSDADHLALIDQASRLCGLRGAVELQERSLRARAQGVDPPPARSAGRSGGGAHRGGLVESCLRRGA